MVVEASNVAISEAKPLSERVAYANPPSKKKDGPLTQNSANPKAQPKSATKPVAKDAKKGRKDATKKNQTRTKRSKPKTAEELDAEMTDYFNNNANAAGAAAAAPTNGAAAGGGDDMGMEEISVSRT